MRKICILIISIFLLILGAVIYIFLEKGFIRFYVPDFLWGAAFAYALSLVQEKRINIFILVVFFGVLFETMQYFGYVSGTADYLDIVCYILGSCTILLLKREKRTCDEKDE